MSNSTQLSSSALIGENLFLRLAEPGVKIGKIHSVFSNGFNLQFKHQLVFVGKHGTGLSAFGLTIAARPFEVLKQSLTAGQMVRIQADTWTFYTRPQIKTLILTQVDMMDLSIPHVTMPQIQASGLVSEIERARALDLSGFKQSQPLLALFQKWLSWSLDDDRSDLVRQLIGAGVGLTPTGDDFLQGMVLMEQALDLPGDLQAEVLEQLENRQTTDVSQAYYEALFAGEVNQSWVTLLQEIQLGTEASLGPIILEIQAYGSTSGNDILVGVLTFLQQIKD